MWTQQPGPQKRSKVNTGFCYFVHVVTSPVCCISKKNIARRVSSAVPFPRRLWSSVDLKNLIYYAHTTGGQAPVGWVDRLSNLTRKEVAGTDANLKVPTSVCLYKVFPQRPDNELFVSILADNTRHKLHFVPSRLSSCPLRDSLPMNPLHCWVFIVGVSADYAAAAVILILLMF